MKFDTTLILFQIALILFPTTPLCLAFATSSSPSSMSHQQKPPPLNNSVGNIEKAQEEDSEDNVIPQIMPADPNDDSIPTLQFGETLRFEELGPIILNTDGTTRRIENWNEMTDREREVTWRRIKKRNEERRKVLEAEQEQQQVTKDKEEL